MYTKMIDMARSPEELKEETRNAPVEMPRPIYPWGLSISLGTEELEKLGLDASCEVGDILHLFALAEVTSVSANQTTDGMNCRVELQIKFLGVESEDEENEEMDKEEDKRKPIRLPYK